MLSTETISAASCMRMSSVSDAKRKRLAALEERLQKPGPSQGQKRPSAGRFTIALFPDLLVGIVFEIMQGLALSHKVVMGPQFPAKPHLCTRMPVVGLSVPISKPRSSYGLSCFGVRDSIPDICSSNQGTPASRHRLRASHAAAVSPY